MRTLTLFTLAITLLSCGGSNRNIDGAKQVQATPSPIDSLRANLQAIIRDKKATVGVAIMQLEDGTDTLSILGDRHFALMSVAKFPQVLALLHLADEGKYDVKQPIQFGPEDLKQRTGSSLLKDHPQSSFSLSLPEVLRYCIGQSDNITSNKIFALEGGPGAVKSYVRSTGIGDIGITTDYAHMKPDSPMQNWSTPKAMVSLLQKFHRRELLSDSNHALLWTAMLNATSGANRIRAGLPAGTVVGDKTGTSGTDEKTGITAAFNDVGIVQLPNGKHYGIAVFIGDSRENADGNAAVIAAVSKAVWEYFSAKEN